MTCYFHNFGHFVENSISLVSRVSISQEHTLISFGVKGFQLGFSIIMNVTWTTKCT